MKIKVLLTYSERHFSNYGEAFKFCLNYPYWWRMYVENEYGDDVLFLESYSNGRDV